jgi:hypothetical protein
MTILPMTILNAFTSPFRRSSIRDQLRFRLIAPFFIILSCWLGACNQKTNGANGPLENKSGTGPAITEADVKNFVTTYQMHDIRDFEECKITFDSGVRVGAPERHSFHNGITTNCYPVKVDFSVFRRNKAIKDKGLTSHHRGGVYYFYRNSFNEWEMESEGVDVKRD